MMAELNGCPHSVILEKTVVGGRVKLTVRCPGPDTNEIEVDVTIDPALHGRGIRVWDAAQAYNVHQGTLTRWADAGYIGIMERGPKLLLLDEFDVARAVAIYNAARQVTTPRRAGWVLKRELAA